MTEHLTRRHRASIGVSRWLAWLALGAEARSFAFAGSFYLAGTLILGSIAALASVVFGPSWAFRVLLLLTVATIGVAHVGLRISSSLGGSPSPVSRAYSLRLVGWAALAAAV